MKEGRFFEGNAFYNYYTYVGTSTEFGGKKISIGRYVDSRNKFAWTGYGLQSSAEEERVDFIPILVPSDSE